MATYYVLVGTTCLFQLRLLGQETANLCMCYFLVILYCLFWFFRSERGRCNEGRACTSRCAPCSPRERVSPGPHYCNYRVISSDYYGRPASRRRAFMFKEDRLQGGKGAREQGWWLARYGGRVDKGWPVK